MTEERDPPKASAELEALAAKRKAAQDREGLQEQVQRNATAALGGGFQIAVEMLAALAVGTGLGYIADRMFGTLPWIMVAGIFLGFAAGVRNMIRSAKRMNARRQDGEDKTG